jgi:hypothetical protein
MNADVYRRFNRCINSGADGTRYADSNVDSSRGGARQGNCCPKAGRQRLWVRLRKIVSAQDLTGGPIVIP